MPDRIGLYRYADTVGDGTGTKNAIGNYSSAAQSFKINGPDFGSYQFHRVIVTVKDVGKPASDAYGFNVTLTNGIYIYHKVDGVLRTDLTDGVPVKTNSNWGRMCHDVEDKSFTTGDGYLSVRWTFAKSGTPVRLLEGHTLEFVLNDDFSGLTEHYFMCQGVRVN